MNEAEHGGSGFEQPDTSAVTSTGAPSSLRDEHDLLMHEVNTRAEMVLREADEGRWPEHQLRELLNYLHLEVLRQVTDSEWLLFRTAYRAPDELALLRRDHLELRLAIDALTQAAATGSGADGPSPQQLAAATRDLLAQLEGHLTAERQLLTDLGVTPSAASPGGQPHEWYSFTEGPVIDLDQLPGEQGIDAALGRLMRLGPDEQIELRSSSDPSPLWQRLAGADPGGFGLAYLERGPQHWRLQITRRAAGWTPHPYA
jgi:uncharacterized protein (DUF2249 family)